MKIKIIRVEPTTQVSSSGKKKYYAYSDDGDRHIAWGDWIENAQGKEVEVTIKKESYRGQDYTIIWPVKEEAAVASEVDVRIRPKTDAAIPQTKVTSIDKRDRLMAKESALKSATTIWSSKVTAGIDGQGKEDPLEMAKRFYDWILRD